LILSITEYRVDAVEIIKKKLAELKPYEKNPRKNDHAVDRIATAIKEFGFNVPVLIEGCGKIIDGHLRYKAALQLELEVVPCVIIDNLSPAQIKAFRLSINKMAELAVWDEELLSIELQELELLDFNLDLIGFDSKELDDLFSAENRVDVDGDVQTIDIRHIDIEDIEPTVEELAVLSDRNVLIEYSGGKDSTAAVIWAKRYLPDNDMVLCFVDLGADFVGMQKYLVEASEFLHLPLSVLRSDKNIFDALLSHGSWPHFHHPYCHGLLHEALDRELHKYAPDEVVVLRGGRSTEKASKSNKAADRFLKVQRNEKYIYYQPLYFAKKELCEQMLVSADMPMWEGYTNGLQRTACRFCPGQKPRAYAVIREKYPDVWKEIMFLDSRLKYGAWTQAPDGSPGDFNELADRGLRQLAKEL